MITKVEESEISPEEVDKVMYEAYNTAFNEPSLPNFSFEEVFRFLIGRGYTIVKAKGMGKTVISESTIDMEVITRDGGYNEVEDVFARSSTQEIPLDFSSPEARAMKLNAVFIKELKHKILFE